MRKRLLLALVSLPIALVLLEGGASLAWLAVDYGVLRSELKTALADPIDHHCAYDPELGWRHVPGKHIPDLYGPGRSITINADGYRGSVDVVGRKPPDRFRLVCLGDSFTLGVGVDDADTYPALLERGNPGLQVVNMGQGGYSVGQCWLWYRREGAALEADCLVFAYINDDIWRMAGTHSASGYGIPTFDLVGDELSVANQPVPERVAAGRPIVEPGRLRRFLIEHSGLFRTLGALRGSVPEPAARDADQHLAVGLAIFRAVHGLAREQGIPLVLVQLPEQRQVLVPELRQNYLAIAQRVRALAQREGFLFLDVLEDFVAAGPRAVGFFLDDDVWKHFSPAGNRLVAARLETFLRAQVPGYPGGTGLQGRRR